MEEVTRESSGEEVTTLILAAGRGTRMKGFLNNKTLLPLLPGTSIFDGSRPFIKEIISQVPKGRVAIVVHHDAETVKETLKEEKVVYIYQPELNGTGGALLASREFLEKVETKYVLITMGDVPLVRSHTYRRLIKHIDATGFEAALIAFRPSDPKQYGRLLTEGEKVKRIVEWQYWKDLSKSDLEMMNLCNAGIYALRRGELLACCNELFDRYHSVKKNIDGTWREIKEYFLTDLVEIMNEKGMNFGFIEVPEWEVIGADTPEALRKIQALYAGLIRSTVQ
ncbi:NTP transferase domain-containing protein [Thermodesulforhabdus norvegica]|uniref:MobA-like NTP transferase domain-containing protein n=1 Tax=Thermodesulforhabdus norvegica TaxID=39841 RepID=A0A1I4VEQ6_9BACT|nr:NTP transferase domain-containing protein [Thermodesulforhabdus norvegica]SFM99563.1 MobA-like NTP transferase domain-containing protein [Thermodesulforhabdus norvegica]